MENSIKESLRMQQKQREIEELIKIKDLNLDSPIRSEIKKFWAWSINKETPIIAAIFFH